MFRNGIIFISILLGYFMNNYFNKNDENLIQITSDDTCDYYGQTIATIVNDGDCAGAVVMCAGEEKEFQGEVAGKLVKTAADFLSKQIG